MTTMKPPKINPELEFLQALHADFDKMPYQEAKAKLQQILRVAPEFGHQISLVLLDKTHNLQSKLAESEDKCGKLQKAIEEVNKPPWHPGAVVKVVPGDQPRALTAVGSRRLLVTMDKKINPRDLRSGMEVFLNNEMQFIVALGLDFPRCGEMASFDHLDNGRAVLKTNVDDEIMVDLSEDLANDGLKPGDTVLYNREYRLAFEKVEKSNGEHRLLEEAPNVTFDQIGGLDFMIDDLLNIIELHHFHRELVEQHHLERIKGVCLYGPTGTGKTLTAKAISNWMASLSSSGSSRFMNIKPGSQRSVWYGGTELNYREMFRVAKEASRNGDDIPIVMFFDELDNLGCRWQGADGASIDSRTMTALLAEVEGLEEAKNVFLVGATNRIDLVDPALLAPHRFGGKLFEVPRPNRSAALDIFRKYFVPELPYYANGRKASSKELCEEIIDAAVSKVYAPRGDGNVIATLTFRDGKKEPVMAGQVMSGAIIANIARDVSYRSCIRGLYGTPGIVLEDVLHAIDDEMANIASRMKKTKDLRGIIDLPEDADVVKVEVHATRHAARSHESLSN